MTELTLRYGNDRSLQSLQMQIRSDEGTFISLKKLEALDTGAVRFILATYDTVTSAPSQIRLVTYDGAAPGPGDGERLVCTGTVWLNGEATPKKVAAFRRGAAGAPAPDAAPAPAPAPTPAPNPGAAPTQTPAPGPVTNGGEEDTGTGPEGNPALNSDGTPKKGGSGGG